MWEKIWRWMYWWGPVVLIYSGVTFLSHQPKLPGPESLTVQFFWFKTAHILVYGSLAWTLCRALVGTKIVKMSRFAEELWWKVGLIIIVLAAVDEFHQMFIPGRGPHARDILIDALGASVAVLWWQTRYNRKTPREWWRRVIKRLTR